MFDSDVIGSPHEEITPKVCKQCVNLMTMSHLFPAGRKDHRGRLIQDSTLSQVLQFEVLVLYIEYFQWKRSHSCELTNTPNTPLSAGSGLDSGISCKWAISPIYKWNMFWPSLLDQHFHVIFLMTWFCFLPLDPSLHILKFLLPFISSLEPVFFISYSSSLILFLFPCSIYVMHETWKQNVVIC